MKNGRLLISLFLALGLLSSMAHADCTYNTEQCLERYGAQRAEIRCLAETLSACTTDSDCMIIADPKTRCVGDYCPVAVSKNKEADFSNGLGTIESRWCTKEASCCPMISGACDGGYVGCWDGSCRYIDAPLDGGYHPTSACGTDTGVPAVDTGTGSQDMGAVDVSQDAGTGGMDQGGSRDGGGAAVTSDSGGCSVVGLSI